MNAGLDVPPKRTRESTSKVRTGCSTCRLRRVKCDETKPSCRRCTTGDRKCEYNNTPTAPTLQNRITIYVPPLQSQAVFLVNDHGLNFFQQNVATKLDGQFSSNFWSKLVLQLSHSEPSIRHAVAAISINYQDLELSVQHPAGYVNANPEARKEWNMAMKSLSARIQAHPNSNLVPLVCCLLFTCIEFLKGNGESSMLHVEGGIKILAALRRRRDGTPTILSNTSSNDLKIIEDYIVPVFSGLSILCSLSCRMTPSIYGPISEEYPPHEDLTDSRRHLLEILDPCIRFIGEAGEKVVVLQIGFEDLIEQAKLQARLNAWFDRLQELLGRMHATGDLVNQNALNLLLVHYKVMYIWIRVCTSAEETATDSYHAEFEALVGYAEQIVKSDGQMVTPQLLSFDIQILGPLYYATLKCRHPAIRRRALAILRSAPWREGLWNAHHAYATAKRVIELEEMNLSGQELPSEKSRLHGLPLPDDEARTHLGEVPFDYQTFNHKIVPSPACSGTVEATFRTKPWGLSGDWHITTEHIKL